MLDNKKIGQKIFHLRREMGLTQKELAEKVGTVQATVHKWESARQKPSSEHAHKLAEFFGRTTEDLLGMTRGEDEPGRMIRVVGALQAGNWVDAAEMDWDDDRRYEIPAALPTQWDGVTVYGFEVEGPSMNKLYPDGSVVFVAPLDKVPGSPAEGDVVVAIQEDGGLYERTLKQYAVDESGRKWLWPRSDHPEHQAPLQFKSNSSVRVAGVVLGATILSAAARRRK